MEVKAGPPEHCVARYSGPLWCDKRHQEPSTAVEVVSSSEGMHKRIGIGSKESPEHLLHSLEDAWTWPHLVVLIFGRDFISTIITPQVPKRQAPVTYHSSGSEGVTLKVNLLFFMYKAQGHIMFGQLIEKN